ncbi:C-type lectin lectoxin-Lio3-like, partial [Saccostrea cucullata]|uniref:C-type lectin lectoxin-Lio3-like n=1 Tax=Saccostrea cuccullata TaxID=36930 RepID=UPI002ED2B380
MILTILLLISINCMLADKNLRSVSDLNSPLLSREIIDLHFNFSRLTEKYKHSLKETIFETKLETKCTYVGCSTKRSTSPCVLKSKTCPKGWKRRGRSCYNLFLEKVNWFQAQINCRKYDANLVQIEDKREGKWLKRQYPGNKAGIQFWIDACDLAKEGQWMLFSSGKKATYTPWGSSEPNNYKSDEHCAIIADAGQ